MKPNELDIFYVIDTETTGFSPKNADIIQLSAIKAQNVNGEYRVLGEFDSYINPQYPLPDAIVEFNKKENTGITDELLSKAPLAKDVAPEFAAFVGENPVVVLHNAPFDMKFINKLFSKNLGHNLQTGDIVDTLQLCRENVTGKSHKLGDMFNLSEKKFSEGNPKFHTALADAYATLDVLDYLKNNFFQQEVRIEEPQFEEFGETKPNNINTHMDIEQSIRNAVTPDNLANVMCNKNISSIAVGLNVNGTINNHQIAFCFSDQPADLADDIVQFIKDEKCNAFLITRKEATSSKPETYELTGYAHKGKGESLAIKYTTFGELKHKDDVLDMRFEIADIIDEVQEYTKRLEQKKERKKEQTDARLL